ncbi:sigma-70 family RNA polymerase sigma factor [Arenibaculum sp.]|jgi:RNA polymerase sigma-32 factor|uniref:sigma-70 family RNA polymerase sigma factor n=1 Tax=Arenibaculum sp. TaxID=2865862 RepID=UPI002E0F34E3|nr:sigma-70 family RNA polymerase sigma factor [Arenibaculum sp.]
MTTPSADPLPPGGLLGALRLPLLSPDEERELALRSAAGDAAAAERLIAGHLRMVVKAARSYGRLGLPVNDLIQEGTLGLIQAVRKFNPDRDARLSTYAAWWIRAAMQDYAVRSWSLVRVGKTAAHRALFFALRRVATELRTGADALSDEVLARLAARFDLPKTEVSGFARRIAGKDQSLDVPAPDAASLAERLVCARPNPEEEACEHGAQRLWHGLIDRALSMLPAREATIIRKRHLTEAAPTFEAIGRELGISKDRVRQLEKRALERLRDALLPLAAAHGLPEA